MAKPSSKKIYSTREWRPVRIGVKLHDAMKKIRKNILINTDIDDISFEEITNIIVRHKLWQTIAEDAGNVKEDEIMQYGKN